MIMRRWTPALFASLAFACVAAQAEAQMPKIKGASSVLKGGLPAISSIGAGNAAGLLGYCVKNQYLSASGANSVISGLMKKPGTAASPSYAAGRVGNILNGNQPPVSLDRLPKELKSQACSMVLKKGATLL
jgi:hypothetical protein